MNPISDLIITRNEEIITMIVDAYELFGVPAFIRIETGTFGRNIISPTFNRGYFQGTADIYEQRFNYYNPVEMIKFLCEKEELYLEAYSKIMPGQAVIAIDYESETIRELFDPIIFPLNPITLQTD